MVELADRAVRFRQQRREGPGAAVTHCAAAGVDDGAEHRGAVGSRDQDAEEHAPRELVRQARLAEEAGFDGLWISDHFHPWLDAQGNSGFVWSMIGAISQACWLPVTTAVTCLLSRTHPAIVAQAAATLGHAHAGLLHS